MTTTDWERRKSLSDRLRSVWDAKRDASVTWPQAFDEARDALRLRLEEEAHIVASIGWEEFQRLQGWRDTIVEN